MNNEEPLGPECLALCDELDPSHLEQCAQCRDFVEAQQLVAQHFALSRTKEPEEQVFSQMQLRIMASLPSPRPSWLARLRELFALRPTWAAAAVTTLFFWTSTAIWWSSQSSVDPEGARSQTLLASEREELEGYTAQLQAFDFASLAQLGVDELDDGLALLDELDQGELQDLQELLSNMEHSSDASNPSMETEP